MQWSQIKEQAEIYRRDTINYARRYFNEGKSLLANMYVTACAVKTQSYTDVEAHTQQTLPTDYRYVHKVSTEDYTDFQDFTVDPITKKITFFLNGDFTLTYLAETDDVVGTDSEIPQIHTAYHYALAKYIAAKECEHIVPSRYKDLYTQFLIDADAAHKSIKRGLSGSFRLARRTFR